MGTVFRRPGVPPPVRIRRDVNKLAANDPIITFFEKAIGVMQGRPIDDPTSWRFQAAIHDYPTPDTTLADRRREDPFAAGSDVLPANRGQFWRKCEHGSWFFLAWHRMYLHNFEKIIMGIVAGMPGGPTDWALPYWNYSVSAAAALLPAPFRSATLPDGTPNHLFVAQRTPNANAGTAFLGPADTNLNCLKSASFAVSFEGGRVAHHPPGGSPGTVEQTPHNAVHAALGGANGFMGGFSTAPLDPMFWLHHCNIDRLWEVWVQRQKAMRKLTRNPKPAPDPDASWLGVPFDFAGSTGMTPQDVLNTRVTPLSYEYEDTSDPFNGAP